MNCLISGSLSTHHISKYDVMEKKTLTLRVCNQEIAVSIDPNKECDVRKVAKTINEEFAKVKEAHKGADDKTAMAYMLLQRSI